MHLPPASDCGGPSRAALAHWAEQGRCGKSQRPSPENADQALLIQSYALLSASVPAARQGMRPPVRAYRAQASDRRGKPLGTTLHEARRRSHFRILYPLSNSNPLGPPKNSRTLDVIRNRGETLMPTLLMRIPISSEIAQVDARACVKRGLWFSGRVCLAGLGPPRHRLNQASSCLIMREKKSSTRARRPTPGLHPPPPSLPARHTTTSRPSALWLSTCTPPLASLVPARSGSP